jgi:hypothetical protein
MLLRRKGFEKCEGAKGEAEDRRMEQLEMAG